MGGQRECIDKGLKIIPLKCDRVKTREGEMPLEIHYADITCNLKSLVILFLYMPKHQSRL